MTIQRQAARLGTKLQVRRKGNTTDHNLFGYGENNRMVARSSSIVQLFKSY